MLSNTTAIAEAWARLDRHRRTTDWLWSKVELAIQLEQQERNRRDFDEQLGLKPAAGYFGTNPPPDDNIAGASAPTPDPESENTPESPASQGSGGVRPKRICRQPLPKRLDP